MKGLSVALALLGVIVLGAGPAVLVRENPQPGQLSLSHAESPFAFVEEVGTGVTLTFKGKPVWHYRYGVAAPPNAGELNATSGFLHPVWTPTGVVVTDWGASDHYHHRGIFFAWTYTRWGELEPDFWNLYKGTGRTRFEAFERMELHPDRALLATRHVWHAKKGDAWVPVVSERWTIVTYAPKTDNPPYWMFDLTTELVNVSDSPLEVPEYRYGGLGYRGARQWWEKQQWEVLTAEGRTKEDSDATDTRWVLQGGLVDGQWGGLTLMDHPKNFGFPNRLRVAPTFPYVGFAPMRKQGFVMRPKEPMVFRFRIVVHSTKPSTQELDALWQDFAKQ